MQVLEILDQLQKRAMSDPDMRRELLLTRAEEDPYRAFCQKARELGYEIYEMELIIAGEEMVAAMKRSTNGGGENSPLLLGEDDPYELFFSALESLSE